MTRSQGAERRRTGSYVEHRQRRERVTGATECRSHSCAGPARRASLLLPLLATGCALLSPQPQEPADPLGHRISFAAGEVVLDARAEQQIAAVAAHLKARPDLLVVRVAGHADAAEVGDEPCDLDRRRARAVVDRLVALGVSQDRLAVARYGTTRPVDAAASEAARQRNRRVELTLVEREDDSRSVPGPGALEP